jgi:hypothetical protein
MAVVARLRELPGVSDVLARQVARHVRDVGELARSDVRELLPREAVTALE